jgi:hypothetical protein
MALSGKRMPIQVGAELDLRTRRGERVCVVRSIPWEMICDEAAERQSEKNHNQSVAGIAKRGGYSACEAICVISCIPWVKVGGEDEEVAHRILYAMHALFNRGQRQAETACEEIALAIDSGRGNEKEIARAIRDRRNAA